jgi:hypothetical protein
MEPLLGDRVQIEAVRDAVLLDVCDERGLEQGIVVAVVQGAGAGEKVQMAAAVHIEELGADRTLEDVGEGARVGLHLGLVTDEDVILGHDRLLRNG